MKRLILSSRSLWHAWRASRLDLRAMHLQSAAEAHWAQSALDLAASYSLARAPLPSEDNGGGCPRASEPAPAGGYSVAGQMLLASIVGLFIAALWIWISARAGR
jgi:hypothetical protein